MQVHCLLHGRGHARSLLRASVDTSGLFSLQALDVGYEKSENFLEVLCSSCILSLWPIIQMEPPFKLQINKYLQQTEQSKLFKKQFIFAMHFLYGPDLDFSGCGGYAARSEKAVQGRVYTQEKVCDTVSVSTFGTTLRTMLLYANLSVAHAAMALWWMKMDSPVKVRSSK